MQKYLKYILVGIIFCGLYSCQDMTKVYEEFEVPGGLKYPGQVMAPVHYSGHDRAKIEAATPVDPSVVEARVFWNYFKDSLSVNINPDDDLFVAELNNLPENDYAFVLRTYDNNGNISVPLELFGATYGENYMRQITNRTVENATLTDNGGLIISFGGVDISNGAFKSEVLYADTLGAMKGVSIIVTESTLIIDDFIGGGSEFSYRTAFRPDTLCLDTFYTESDSHSRFYLDNTNWTIEDFSTEYPRSDTWVINVIDGDPGTRWHSHVDGSSSYPHHVVIDLGAVKTISEIEIYRHNGDTRAADKIQLLIGTDSEDWVDLGLFDFDRHKDGPQSYPLPTEQAARYIKYVGVEGPINNQLVLGEIAVYGY